MKRILFLLALVLSLSGCSKKSTITIDGILKDTKAKYIYLNRLDIDIPVLIDSAKISKKGYFSLKVNGATEPQFYQLGYSSSNFVTLLANPGEKINLAFKSVNLFENYSISGSEGSSKLQYLDFSLAYTKRKLDSLSYLYKKAAIQPAFDTKAHELDAEFSKLVKAQRKKNIEFIITNTNSLASIKAIYQRINPDAYVLYDPRDLQYLKIVTDSLTKHYPNSKEVQALARDFQKEMKQWSNTPIDQLVKTIPQMKLDAVLKDIAGTRISLSSLKGKYVLLTFWSFKSQNCVEENLQLKEYYKLYNKKGLEIYQVDLDESDNDWKAAVKFDELPWISTKEDDPKDLKVATLFNVKILPTNYLFNKEGSIIASDLHGKSLQLKFDQLFNK